MRAISASIVSCSLFLLPLVSCQTDVTRSSEYGTFFTIINNTYGVNDFVVGEPGTYPISFGAIDYGRNLGRVNHYQDSIGYIHFDQNGFGTIEIIEQDSIHTKTCFTYTMGKVRNNQVDLYIEFSDAELKTYVTRTPLASFNYTKLNDSLWVYKSDISTYSGKFVWTGNKIHK